MVIGVPGDQLQLPSAFQRTVVGSLTRFTARYLREPPIPPEADYRWCGEGERTTSPYPIMSESFSNFQFVFVDFSNEINRTFC